jgi:hypothetical protein
MAGPLFIEEARRHRGAVIASGRSAALAARVPAGDPIAPGPMSATHVPPSYWPSGWPGRVTRMGCAPGPTPGDRGDGIRL